MERKRHFFKVLIPGFHQRLNLPPAVSKELETQKSRRATLESCKGAWEITMSKNYESNLLCFDEGWSEFVESHALHVGYFLVFQHTRNLHFDILVFDSTACEKKFHVEPKTKTKKKDRDNEEALNPTSHPEKRMRGGDERPYFVKKMSPSFATKDARVNIPVEFVKRNGLGQKSSVSLRDPNNGREWSVDLSVETRANGGFRNRMHGQGWHHFYLSNKLKIGDTCVFELRRRLLTSTTIFFDVYFNVRAPM